MLHLLSVMTQAGLFFKYLFLWLLPNPAWMSVDMREQFIPGWSAWQGWLGVFAFISYGLLALRLLLRGGSKGLFGFSLLYPWLLFLIEFSSIRVQEPFVLYRSYLWMPGLMLLVPLLLLSLPGRRTLLALGLFVLLMLPLAWNRLWVFSDNYQLWNDVVLLLPGEKVAGADRIYFNRGQAHENLKEWKAAGEDFERVIAISPRLAPVYYHLGMAYLHQKRFEEALAQFDFSIAIDPKDARQYTGKALALMSLHQSAESRKQVEKGCELGDSTACMLYGIMGQKK